MADSVTTIHERMLSAIDDGYDKSKGEAVYDLTMPMAIEASRLDEKSDRMLDQGFAETATGEDLDRKAADMGVDRKSATYASGTVTVTGVAGASVPKGGLVASDTVSFAFISDAVIPASGTIDAPVECTSPGARGNVPAGAIKSFPKTLEGLRTVTNRAAIKNGYDEETDDDLRDRYYIKMRTPATSGNRWHYLGWAKEVTGVGDAKVFPLRDGPGTVGVVIINSNRVGASDDLVARVAAHIEDERPIGADVTVTSAAELPVEIAVTLVIDENKYTMEMVKESVESAMRGYLADIAFQEDYVSYAKIGSLLMACPGVLDYSGLRVNGGAENIPVTEESVAVLGGVTLG